MKKTVTLSLVTTVLWFTLFTVTCAQNGSNDPTFNATDKGFGYGDAVNGSVNAIAVQSNGKVIIAGDFSTYNGTSRNNIARLNADGTLDATFNVGTGANDDIRAIALQSDGQVIIGGNFTSYNGTVRNRIARLNANGTLDATFDVGTGTDESVEAMALQSDGKVIIGGSFTAYNGTARGRIARINTNGSLDATFAGGAGANDGVSAMVIQDDGKIIIGGWFSAYNGTAGNGLARLSAADGSLDATFTTGTGVGNGFVLALALDNNGKLIAGGGFEAYNGTVRNNIVRMNTDGSVDNTFAVGSGTDYHVVEVAIQSDGKILIGGWFKSYNGTEQNGITRLNDAGSLDDTFAIGVALGLDMGITQAISLQSDGKIIIGGFFDSYAGIKRNGIARINANGSLDFTFIKGTGADADIYTTVVQGDGKILIGGDFTSYNGTTKNHITRLNSDGTPDASFTGAGADSTVYAMAIQSNGKIIIGGNFHTYNGVARNRIARINANGSLDESFDPGANAGLLYYHVYAIAVQPDGKIIVGGNILNSNGQGWEYAMVRLNADGSLDAAFSFDDDDYFFGDVRTLAIQADGKIIMGGDFILSSDNGAKRFDYIARLDTNGKIDGSFTHEVYAGSVMSAAVQNDGKIIIGGYFSVGAYTNIARLNSNGSLDGAFAADKNTNGSVHSILIHEGGKIIIGGNFTAYNGTTRNQIVRLTPTGSLDNTFNVGTGTDNFILSMAFQKDGKVVVAGAFTAYNGVGRNRVARILNCTNPDMPTVSASAVTNCGAENTTLSIATGALNTAAAWKWYSGTCVGTPVGTGASISVSPAITTTYYVRGEGSCITPGACGSITINVKPLPNATVDLNGKTITAKLSGAAYQWLDCANNTPVGGATSQSYTATHTGRYAVKVTANGCSATSACTDIVITAIHETVAHSSMIAVYPNPSNGAFTIQSGERGVYSVRNLLGQTVESFELNDANHYTVRIEHLAPDIYFITRTDHNTPPVKVIVIR